MNVSTAGSGSEPGAFVATSEPVAVKVVVVAEVSFAVSRNSVAVGGAERGVETEDSDEVLECDTKPPAFPPTVDEYENDDFGTCE